MKKTVFAIALSVLLTGCAYVSEEQYNSLAAENDSLLSRIEQLESDVEILESNAEQLESERNELETRLNEAQNTESVSESETDNSVSANEKIDIKKDSELFIAEHGQRWYVALDGAYCVSYIDEYSGENDKEIIAYSYYNIIEIMEKYPALITMLEWRNKNEEVVGMTALTNFLGTVYISDNRIAWSGECEKYNLNEDNLYWVNFWETNYPAPKNE